MLMLYGGKMKRVREDKVIPTQHIMDQYWPFSDGLLMIPKHKEIEFLWQMRQVQILMIKHHLPAMGYEDTIRAQKRLAELEAK